MECARECGIHRRRRSVESSSEVEAHGSSKRGHTDSSHQVTGRARHVVRGISPAVHSLTLLRPTRYSLKSCLEKESEAGKRLGRGDFWHKKINITAEGCIPKKRCTAFHCLRRVFVGPR